VSWTVPETYEFGGDVVVPFYAGEEIPWSVKRHPE
jgi:dihydroorotase